MTVQSRETAAPDPAFRRTVARLLEADPGQLAFEALAGGVSSDIWRVRLGDISFCAKRALPQLKVAERWEAPVSRNAEEVRWLRTVGAWASGEVAEVLAADEGAGVALLAWYDPAEWRNWKQELLSGRVSLECARRLGALLGNIASRSRQMPELSQAFANEALFDALRIDPFFRHILERHPAVGELVERLERERSTLVHGDFSPKNVLVGKRGAVRVLDAECACWGSPAFDPGYLLAHLLLKQLHTANLELLEAARSFWRAYGSAARGSTAPDAGVVQVIGGMLLARVDGKSPVDYLRPAEAELARRRGIELLEQPPASIEALLATWT